MLIFRRVFLCARRRRRLRDPKSSQHTLRGKQQVWSKNLELQTCFVFKFLSLQKSELKLGFDFKKTWAWIQTWVWILEWWRIGQKREKKKELNLSLGPKMELSLSSTPFLEKEKKKKKLSSSSTLFFFAQFEFLSTLKKTWMGKKQTSSLG